MSGVPPYVNFFGNDWFTGVIGLKADERGVYISMCVYIWTTGRRVPACDAEASRMMGLQFNNYQRVRDILLSKGKVQKHADGYGIKRAETELDRARDRLLAGAEHRRRPDAPVESVLTQRAEGDNSVRPEAVADAEADGALLSASAGAPAGTSPGAPVGAPVGACRGNSQNTEQYQHPLLYPEPEPKQVPPKAPKGAGLPILEAFELWNSKALELGLPQAATLSPSRRRSIGARLREAGGMDGWRKMLAELGRSAFLLGRKDGCDFRADLDFVLKPSRFPKILDGGYADKDAPAAGNGPWWQDPAKLATMTPDRWRTGIAKHANGKWPIMELGPWPGDPKCLVPRELVDELHLTEKYDPRTGLAKGAWAAEQRKLHEVRA